MIQRWLTAVLQLMVAVLAIIVVTMATQLRTNAGLTGASLVTLVTFGYSIAWLIVNYTTLETSLGAVNRLRTFSSMVEPEDRPEEDTKPPSDWPRCGRIDITDISASYNTDVGTASPSRLVLKDLNLTILPGEKLAICGRTGSGKSSLMLLLLKLLDPLPENQGHIEIDGVPFHRLDRATLRDRVIAIPQDAAFLPDGSTIKANLDPWNAATEVECMSVLETVRLGGFLQDRGSITAKMNADDLSAGQKQLFSLGRAILRKRMRDKQVDGGSGGILLLDEVSSSVDIATERTMLEFIRGEFAKYTIVMVSHRLEMVLDFFDSVAVLERGTVIETGRPTELVESPDTRFGELWRMGRHS